MKALRISHSGVVDGWRERERELRRLGVDVRLVSARAWNEGGREVALQPRAGEDVVGLRTFGSHPALFLYEPVRLWRELGAEVDVLDIHEEPYALCTAEVLALRALRRALTRRPRRKAPYVVYSAQNLRKRYPVPFRWTERAVLQGAAAVSVCNAEAGRIVRDKGLRGEVALIPLGLDPAVFHPDPARRPGTGGGRVVVGYAGRLERYKGVLDLLAAVRQEARLELDVAGDGPLRAEVERAAAGSGGRIRLTGSLGPDGLAAFYRRVDVLAVPSSVTPGWIEQFGRVVAEAMACGTPVVATRTGALPEVVGDGGVLVPPDDPAALRAALLRVGTEPGLAERLGRAGLEQAGRYTWERVGAAYRDLYARLADTGRTGASPAARSGADPGARQQAGPTARGLQIVMVAYHHPELVEAALRPLAGLWPTTVVDNSSSPQVREVALRAGARYLDPGRNGGFAAGVNHALARLDPADDVLLLNPDAQVAPAAVQTLRAALHAEPGVAAVAPAQIDGDGAAARVLWPFPTPARALLEAAGLGHVGAVERPRSGQFVIGSVLLLNAEALADVGPFDESFFLYSEETDWQRRAERLGWRSVLVPSAHATHLGGATSADGAERDVHFHASQERYFRKHHGPAGWLVARTAQIAGASARGVALPGVRGAAARQRAALYLRGPLRTERALSEDAR